MGETCPKCGGTTVQARPRVPISGDLTAFKEPAKALGNSKITFNMTICNKRGFTELYADEPQRLQGK